MKFLACRFNDGVVADDVVMISAEDIAHISTYGRKPLLLCKMNSGEEYVLVFNFEQYREGFVKYCGFTSVDRGVLVNLDNAKDYQKDKDRLVFKHNSEEITFIPVARKHIGWFRRFFKKK